MTTQLQDIDANFNKPRISLGYVLVVDDKEKNRTLLRDPLEARG
jgi:hypothetical protein